MNRTDQQNKALHVFFKQLSDQLNESGLDMKRVLMPEISIGWTPTTVKECLWRPIQQAYTGKKSTKDLETTEIDQIFAIINKHLGQEFGLATEFPSIETIISRLREIEAEREING